MTGKSNRLISGAVLRTIAWAANVAVAFFMMPFLVHSLGDRWYGFWALVSTFVGYYGFLDLGLATAVSRYVSRAIGKKDDLELNKVVSTACGVYSRIGGIALLITVIIVSASPFFITNPEERIAFMVAILLMGLAFSLGIVFRSFSGILISHLRYDLMVYMQMLKLFIRTASVIFVIQRGYGIMGLAVSSFTIDLLEFYLLFKAIKYVHPSIAITKALYDREKVGELFKYGTVSFVAQLADHLKFNMSNIVISAFVGVNAVTLYSIPLRLVQYFIDAIVSMIGMMTPVFSQYEGTGDFAAIREKFSFVTRLSTMLAGSAGGAVLVMGKLFIMRWMGPTYTESCVILAIMIIPLTCALMQNPSIGVLYGISKHRFYAVANLCEGIANVCISILLVRSMGIVGVALGMAIPMMIMKVFVQPVYVCKILSLSLRAYLWTMWRMVCVIGVIQGILYISVVHSLPATYPMIGMWGMIVFCMPILILFIMFFSTREKSYFSAFLMKLYPKRGVA